MARPRVNFVHTLLRARDYQNRPEFDRLCDWWRGGGQGVCALVGIGGAGKTAVADRFLRILPGAMADDPNLPKDNSLSEPAALFVFSFYDAPNPDALVAELAAWLDDRPPDDSEKKYSYEQMVRLLHGAADCLIVLDGLEKVQDPGLRGGAFGQITDGRLRDFVLRVAEGTLPGVRVIITTRFRLYDPLAERSPLYLPIRVEELDLRAAVALLRKRGVRRGTDGQLETVARDHGFHALSVDLAGGYIAHFCDGDPDRLPPEPHDKPAAAADAALDPRIAAIREQERKFARLAERYQEALSQSDPAALALLRRVCLFRLGVDARTLASIFTGEDKEGISGPELAELSLEELAGKLQKLAAMRLIEVSGSEQGEDSSFSIHPAVRDGFLAGLDAETAQRGHDAAREGLTASLGGEPGANPSDPVSLDLLEEIVHHALAAGHAQEAWHIYERRLGQYENLGWRLGEYERGERICRAFAGGQPPQTAPLPDGLSEHEQASFINEWGLYLSDLGRLDAAARCYERNIEMGMAQEDWKNASSGNQNLADAFLLAGRLVAGMRAAEASLRLVERADDATGRRPSLTWCAHAHARRGETDAALADFRDGLDWQHKAEGMTAKSLYGLDGVQHTLLLARLGQNEDAVRRTEANKKILLTDYGPNDNNVPLCNLLLAELARECGDLPGAHKLLMDAHEWAIARDAKEPLCWSELVRGRIELSAFSGQRSAVGDLPSASEDRGGDCDAVLPSHLAAAKTAIEDGLRIARDCGYGIFHIDLLLLRAQAALHEGRATDAERDIRLALDEGVHPPADTGLPELLAAADKECGYAWGIAEARHLLAEALLLQAAQNLGQPGFIPARFDALPDEISKLIEDARGQLTQCADLRKQIQDPKLTETEKVLDDLTGGALTNYPLEPAPVEAAPVEPVTQPPQADPDKIKPEGKRVVKKHVFLSYCHDNATEVTKLRDDLIAAGEAVWWDQNIMPGQDWKLAIRQAMKDSYAVVLCLSKETEARATSGIFPEALDAIAA